MAKNHPNTKKVGRGLRGKFSSTKKKISLILVLALLGGIFAFAYAATSGTATIGSPSGSPDIGEVMNLTTQNENWGPKDNSPEFENNVVIGGTGGKIENGNLFFIRPDKRYVGGLWIEVELVNREEINNHFTSLTENFQVYIANDGTAEENLDINDNWSKLNYTENQYLSLVGGPATFHISSDNVDNNEPLCIALESGDYFAKENYSSYPGLVHYLSIEEAGY